MNSLLFPSTMLRMVPLSRFTGEDGDKCFMGRPCRARLRGRVDLR